MKWTNTRATLGAIGATMVMFAAAAAWGLYVSALKLDAPLSVVALITPVVLLYLAHSVYKDIRARGGEEEEERLILDDDLIDCYRQAAVALAIHACGKRPDWRSKDDRVYQEVVEGRDLAQRRLTYSSCADLSHWIWYRLGVRAPWVNRQQHAGFKAGVNVSRLAYNLHAETPGREHRFLAGDSLMVWNRPDTKDAHVCVLLEDLPRDPQGEAALTANYGASGMSMRAWPGCNVRRERLVWDIVMGRWNLGGRFVERTLSVAKVLRAQQVLAPPDLTGADLPGEVIDRLTGRRD